MPFSETAPGKDAGRYDVWATHEPTGLGVKVSIISSSALGEISEEDADRIIADIWSAIASNPTFIGGQARRTRSAVDTWTPPAIQ